MSRFRVAHRFSGETEGERCPKCALLSADFMVVMPDALWGCYQCGTVFVPKVVRMEELAGKKAQIELQRKGEEEKPVEIKYIPPLGESIESDFKCDQCDFVAKTLAGLGAHKRRHASAAK